MPLARLPAYEPPLRVCFSCDINVRWQLETDPAKTSEVEVTFMPDGPTRTRVELTHRHLDRHGDGWEHMRAMLSAQAGASPDSPTSPLNADTHRQQPARPHRLPPHHPAIAPATRERGTV